MTSTDTSRPVLTSWTAARRLAAETVLIAGVVLIAGLAGCRDHRMSLTEFQAKWAELTAAAQGAADSSDAETMRMLLDRQLAPYRVGPSDVLAVTLTGADPTAVPPPFQVRVNREGQAMLPIVGAVAIGDLELVDAEAVIQAAYVPAYVKDAAVHVELVSEGTAEVLVVGAVTAPGLVKLGRRERNLMHAIVAAGGVSEVASGKAALRRLREPSAAVVLDLTSPEGVRQALASAPLESGDIVTVESATPNTIFVGGLVNAPRPQLYPQGVRMTVLQALAAAGGLRNDVIPTEATLIRRMPDGTDAQVKLDLNKLYDGTSENLELAAGDILWVPHTLATQVEDFINRNFFLRAGISVNYSVSGIEFLNRQTTQTGGGGRTSNLQDAFDPFGFLTRNQSLQSLVSQPAAN